MDSQYIAKGWGFGILPGRAEALSLLRMANGLDLSYISGILDSYI